MISFKFISLNSSFLVLCSVFKLILNAILFYNECFVALQIWLKQTESVPSLLLNSVFKLSISSSDPVLILDGEKP